jgi:hypothetical protein
VTTILGILNKPALIEWAWRCGLNGQDYKLVRDSAATVGTIAHYLIMCYLKGEEPELSIYSPDDIKTAENSVLSFLEWAKGRSLKPVLLEEPLTSEHYSFGGTIDYFGQLDNGSALLDFKTGKAIYPEMIFQVAAYAQLLEEDREIDGVVLPVDTVRILRIPRSEDEDFEERILTEAQLRDGWEIFLRCLDIYRLQKRT